MNLGLVPDDSPLNYDEWRALLGLPEVSEEIKIRARWLHLAHRVASWQIRIIEQITPAFTELAAQLGSMATALGLEAIKEDLAAQPDTSTPQQRALPRPATAPPMWAQDPTKTRRQR